MKAISELGALRDTTRDYIEANPVQITLTRFTRVRLPSGGWDPTETVLATQSFALTGAEDNPETIGDTGEVTDYLVHLLGYHDADVQETDEFTLDGDRYRVDFVYPERSYRTWIDATFLGPADA